VSSLYGFKIVLIGDLENCTSAMAEECEFDEAGRELGSSLSGVDVLFPVLSQTNA
jgi:hypothetical protein